MWPWKLWTSESASRSWPHLKDRTVRKKLRIPADALILTGATPGGPSVEEQRRKMDGSPWMAALGGLALLALLAWYFVHEVRANPESFLQSALREGALLAVLIGGIGLFMRFGPSRRAGHAMTRDALAATASGGSQQEILAWFDQHWPFYLPPALFTEEYAFVAGERAGRHYLVLSESPDYHNESRSLTPLSRSLLFIADPAPGFERPVRLRELPVPEHGDVANVVRTPAGLFVFWCTPCLGHIDTAPVVDAMIERALFRLAPDEGEPVDRP